MPRSTILIQIQHLLKLNNVDDIGVIKVKSIQIQHLLKLNAASLLLKTASQSIQIQHLLKLNYKVEKSCPFV